MDKFLEFLQSVPCWAQWNQKSCPYTIYIQSFMLLSQVSTNLLSLEESQCLHWVLRGPIESLLRCPAPALRGLLHGRDHCRVLDRSLSQASHSQPYSLSVTESVYLYLQLLQTVSSCPHSNSSSIPTLPLSLSTQSSPQLVIMTGAVLSSGIPYVAPLGSSRVLLSPLPAVAVPLAPVSRGHRSATDPPFGSGEPQRLWSEP